MTTPAIVECKPSKWFKKRAVAVILMFLFFLLWFLKDGIWGYREKNISYVHYQLFSSTAPNEGTKGEGLPIRANIIFAEEKKKFEEANKDKEYSAELWKAFAEKQFVPMPYDAEYVLPKGYDLKQPWPEELVNGFDRLVKNDPESLWRKLAVRKKWDEKVGDKLMYRWKIQEQYLVAGICGGLILITLFISIRIMRRNMRVTDTSYFAPGGKEIPFTAMTVIDKRKWDNKGLATIHYEEDGETKKAKVDGMVYGQFQEEDGAPAEKLFSHIMANFKGEVLEFIEEDDEEESEEKGESPETADTESKVNGEES